MTSISGNRHAVLQITQVLFTHGKFADVETSYNFCLPRAVRRYESENLRAQLRSGFTGQLSTFSHADDRVACQRRIAASGLALAAPRRADHRRSDDERNIQSGEFHSDDQHDAQGAPRIRLGHESRDLLVRQFSGWHWAVCACR